MPIPTTLVVPIPSGNFERNYGVFSVRHSTAQRVIFRITSANRDLIRKAAKMLEMTEAQFVRETCTNMAKALLQHAEKHNEDASNRS